MKTVVRSPVWVGLLAVLVIAMGACLGAPGVPCGSDYCPAGYRCQRSGLENICLIPDICGNSIVEPELLEVCDDGNKDNGDGCSANCQSDESCGNGYRDVGEICDDGDEASGDGCSADCRSDESCGNGYTDVGEGCDDGNETSLDGCSDCRPDATCDDGNQMDGDGCAARGIVESGFACTGVPSVCCADPVSFFALVGDASIASNSNDVILTPATDHHLGAAWFRSPIDLAEPFDVHFRVYLGDVEPGADGMSLVFHRDTRGLASLGGGGGGLGARGIFPSVVVEFDTFDNRMFGEPSDLSCDHTAVFARPSMPLESNLVRPSCLKGTRENVDDGRYHGVHVSWRPDAVSLPTLQVFFDGAEIITHAEDLVDNYFGGNSSGLYFGVTASTGAANNEHKICLSRPL